MNKLTLLFGVILCFVAVNARHFDDRNDRDVVENEEATLKRKEHNPQARHRKRRWQSNYGYDYSPPGYYYPDRRDNDRNNQELLQHISRQLEELTAYIRHPPPPPPPPQPIYIPYPVSFPQIPCVPCTPEQKKTGNVTAGPRISDKDMDPNRNWGLLVSNENDYDDGSDGSRPISFEPFVPKTIMKRPAPQVEHGSVQGSVTRTTAAPAVAQSQPRATILVPGMCNAAILSCCGLSEDNSQRVQCFTNIGCSAFYNGNSCSPESIKTALDSFRTAYSPMN